jgi:hypothetical protein
MRSWGRWATLAVAAALLAGGGSEAAKKGRTFAYIHENAPPTRIHAYEVTEAGLQGVPGTPFDLGATPSGVFGPANTLAYAAKNRVLVASTGTGLLGFAVAEDGSLTPAAGGPVGVFPFLGVAVVRHGQREFAFTANYVLSQVLGYEVQEDGGLAPLPGPTTGTQLGPLGVVAVGKSLFVANSLDESISAFSVGSDGTLTEASNSPFDVGHQVNSLNVDPKGKYLYAPDGAGGTVISGFAIGKGAALTKLAGSPYECGVGLNGGLALAGGPTLFGFSFGDVQALRQAKKGPLSLSGGLQNLDAEAEGGVLTPDSKRLITFAGTEDRLTLYSVGSAAVLTTLDDKPVALQAAALTGAVCVQR